MEWISGNIFIRPNLNLLKGQVIQGHRHNFDHTTIVFKGAVHIKATLPDGSVIERDFGEGFPLRHCLIKAEVVHEITALVDGTEFWCVYAHRDAQGNVTQEVTGLYEAYQ